MTQPSASGAQVVVPVLDEQYVPAAPLAQMAGAALHVQAPEPAAPVQVWFVPQVAGVPLMKKQPLASAAQAATLPLLSQNGPGVPQPVGAALHSQRPVVPLQVWRAPQVCVVLTKKQLSPSCAQCFEAPLSQKSPTDVQPAGGALQPQAPTPAPPEHDWCVPQLAVPETKVQLLLSVWHVETLVLVAQNVPAPPPQSAGGATQVHVPIGFEPVQAMWAGQAVVLAT
jgi:hypothetical protein